MTNETSDRERLLLANFVAARDGISPDKVLAFLETAGDAPAEARTPAVEHRAPVTTGRWFMDGLRAGAPQSGLAGLIAVTVELTSRVAAGRRLASARAQDALLAGKHTATFAATETYRATQREAGGRGAGLSAVTALPFVRDMKADAAGGRWLRARSKTEAPSIATQLSESLLANVDAAMEVGDAIVEGGNFDDAATRRRMMGVVKRAGGKLSTAFWQAHGDAVLGSGAPESLNSKLKTFYAQVGTLKRRIGALSDEPTVSDMLRVVEDVTAVLQTALAIADEVQRLSA